MTDSDSNTADELADLRKQTEVGNRIEETAGEEEAAALADRIDEELAQIESGNAHKNITAHDGTMAAVIRVLEADDELARQVVADLAAAADVNEPEEANRATIMRMALRAGFAAGAPEVLEAAKKARVRRAEREI